MTSQLYYIFFLLVIFTCIIILILLKTEQFTQFEYESDKHYKNHQWMFNVNVFQYSSYLIVSNSSHSLIETLIFVKDAHNKKLKPDNFRCYVRNKETFVTQEIEVTAAYRLVLDHIYKIVCLFDQKNMTPQLNDLAVAVVRANDFDFEWKLANSFPSSMMNFQLPKVIKEEYPRIPKVGVCVNYVSAVYPGIYNWVKMHEYFQAAEIVMHDADKNKLRKLLYPKFKNSFVEIRDYDINNICATDQIKTKGKYYTNLIKFHKYKNTCEMFVRGIFYDYGTHNHLSVNDCYASLSYKYEFVTLYDLDELVLPRAHNILDIAKKSEPFKCSNLTHTCSYKPIINMYDYFKFLIKNEFKDNITKLRSIAFHHSAFLFPDDIQTLLFKNLKDIVVQIKSNSIKFPCDLNTGGKNGFHHGFQIDEKNKDYAIYLSEKYDEIVCLFDRIIKTNSLQNEWKRFVYFHTHYEQRFPKSVHYVHNVQALFTHDAHHFTNDSSILSPSKENGHMNSHYRIDYRGFVAETRTSSIKNIGIDFDYVIFLIQNFTNSC
jgi:hypothetical protein